jgi:hypothetical protein
MLDLSFNNYFSTENHGSQWKINLKPCSRTMIDTFHNESVRAAKIIYEQRQSPITLLFSGGLDGEYMIRVFQTAKIPFKVAIISYGKYNQHDTKYAYDFCNNYNITPITVDIDIKHFIESGKIADIATTAKCCAYQMPSIMHGLTKLDGTLIMANGEPYIKKYDTEWRWQETERVNSYMHWFKQQSLDGTPDFLRYTPEMTLSFITDPVISSIVNNPYTGKLSSRTSKHTLYSINYTFAPRPKYTGWEEIEKTSLMNNEVFNEIEQLKDKYNGQYEVEYNSLIKSLQEVH